MSTVHDPDAVLMLHWPPDERERQALSAARLPRLFVIDHDDAPPTGLSDLEDWIRAPIDPSEMRQRVMHLVHRGAEPDDTPVPELEAGDILRHRGHWVPLSRVERRIVERLLARFDHCVPRAELGDEVDAAALNTRIKRIRHRIEPLGLTIRTIRARGFVLCELDH